MSFSGHGSHRDGDLILGDNFLTDWLRFIQIMEVITENTKDKKEVEVTMSIDSCYSGCFGLLAN